MLITHFSLKIIRKLPLAIAANTPGLSRAKRRCFRLSVACIAGSMYIVPGDRGEILFGSLAFAIPL